MLYNQSEVQGAEVMEGADGCEAGKVVTPPSPPIKEQKRLF